MEVATGSMFVILALIKAFEKTIESHKQTFKH